MTESNGGTPAELWGDEMTINKLWEELASGLAAQLAEMTDVDDHLVIEQPHGHDGQVMPYAQFAGMGDGHVRAELTGDAYLAEAQQICASSAEILRLLGWQGNDEEEPNWFREVRPDQVGELAGEAIHGLQNSFEVPHPELLTFRAWGPNAESASQIGLVASAEVPAELVELAGLADDEWDDEPEESFVLRSKNRQELLDMVAFTVQAKFDEEPTIDDDLDVVLDHHGHPVWIRVLEDQPAVEIFTRVVHEVYSRRATAVELTVLNRRNAWVKWVLIERSVWQRLMIPAQPFAFDHLDDMIDVFLSALGDTRSDLALRTGGKVA